MVGPIQVFSSSCRASESPDFRADRVLAKHRMLGEAISLGLLVDAGRANRALGRVPPAPPIAPDPRGQMHNSLTAWWWTLEFLPHSYYDPLLGRPRWRIPLGAKRVIPDGSMVHSTVEEKMRVDSKYKPSNLPQNTTKEISTIPVSIFETGWSQRVNRSVSS